MVRERRHRLAEFFKKYEPAIQRVVIRVVELEQQQIDMIRPRVKDDIRQVIEQEVREK